LRVANWTPRGNISGPWKKGRAWFSNTTELQFVRNTVSQLPASQNSSKSWRFNNLLHNQVNLSEKNILFVGLLTDKLDFCVGTTFQQALDKPGILFGDSES